MGEYKTPGVYIKEKNAFGNSVVEAETAIPVFIGLTEKALNGNESLLNKPVKITSMTEYYNYFGGAKTHKFDVSVVADDDAEAIQVKCGDKKLQAKLPTGETVCTLYYHITMFFFLFLSFFLSFFLPSSCFVLFCFFKTGFLCVALAILELTL